VHVHILLIAGRRLSLDREATGFRFGRAADLAALGHCGFAPTMLSCKGITATIGIRWLFLTTVFRLIWPVWAISGKVEFMEASGFTRSMECIPTANQRLMSTGQTETGQFPPIDILFRMVVRTSVKTVLFMLLVGCMISAPLFAKVKSAGISGKVTDSAGAVVGDAQVTVTELATRGQECAKAVCFAHSPSSVSAGPRMSLSVSPTQPELTISLIRPSHPTHRSVKNEMIPSRNLNYPE